MTNRRSSPLYFIPGLAFGVFVLAFLSSCTVQAPAAAEPPTIFLTEEVPAYPPADVNPTSPGNDSQEAQIENYMVQEIAGSEAEHRYIVRVSAHDLRAPLPTTKDAIQKCWLYLNGSLSDCTADDFVNSFGQEGTGAWDYSYVIFSIVNIDPVSGKATVRMDELAGPGAGKGLLYTLVQVDGKWETESSKRLWSG
jgi:hypothetical protein